MGERIDALETTRRRMLTGFLIAFVFWQIPTIVQDAATVTWTAAWIPNACRSIAALAGIVWIGFSLRLWRLQRQLIRDPEAAAALDDERVRQARLRALSFGFWVLVVYLTLVRLAAFGLQLSAATVTQLGLVVASSGAIGAFLVYDRE